MTMNRRAFLRNTGFWTASIAVGGLSGCGSNGDSTAVPAPAPAKATGMNWMFPQSIASGDPRADGVMLWTRVVPAGANAVASAPDAGDSATPCARRIPRILRARPAGWCDAARGRDAPA